MKKYRHAIFAVVYTINKGKVEYAILKRKKHWKGWEFTKGKIEKFETKRMAARRESEEETGQKILSVKRFHVGGIYRYKKKLNDRPGIIGQTYHLFAVRVKKGKIRLDPQEHSEGRWMSFEEAMKKLTWQDQKKCLKIVNDWIEKRLLP